MSGRCRECNPGLAVYCEVESVDSFQVYLHNQVSYFPLPYPSCDKLTQMNALFNSATEE